MAQPLLGRLREKLPGARIDVVAPPWVAPVARRMPEVQEVIEAPFEHGKLQLRSRWKLGRMLAGRGYDQAIVLPNTWKAALIPFFADIPLRSGYVGESRYGLLNLTYPNRDSKAASMALHYAALSEAPGKEAKGPLPDPRLLVSAHDMRKAQERFGISGPYAVLCPGAEYGPAKRWPHFGELSRALPIGKVIVGAAGDADAARDLEGTNLVGQTTLEEALALIAGAAYVVTNDSGLMHVAAALRRPQVALFGSSSPEHTPPLSPAARVLWLHIECSPCFERECPLGHFRCMRELTVDKVLAEIHNLAP